MNNTKEYVEPEQDIGDAMQEDKPNNEQQEVEDHDSPPQSLPVQDIPSSSENENPLPKTDIASDDKNMEMECGPLPELEIDKAPNDKKMELQSSPLPNTETETNIASNDNNVEFQSSSLPEIETNIVSSDKTVELQSSTHHPHEEPPPSVPLDDDQGLVKPDTQNTSDFKSEDHELPQSDIRADDETPISTSHPEIDKFKVDAKTEAGEMPKSKAAGDGDPIPTIHREPVTVHAGSSDIKAGKQNGEESKTREIQMDVSTPANNGKLGSKNSFLLDGDYTSEGSESGTEEEQSAFMKELEIFFRERSMDFKPPKFYGEGLNCLKLWRAVTRLGGYDKVTACKLWRQVGESFKPPKTCTTVSWTFRGFYEKALLDYERHKISGGELTVPVVSPSEPINVENQASGSGRARRDAAARAMQGWHSQRLLGNGEVSDPIIKDKNSISLQKRERQLKNIGLLKRKKPSYIEHAVKAARTKVSKPQLDTDVVDIGPPADWVKINVQRTKDCFEVYALVPGLLREEVRVQSDPAGRLVISGEPEHPDNPWGVTPFKKVVSLPSRIDPHQTSAVVTLHGQLFVRVPFEQSD